MSEESLGLQLLDLFSGDLISCLDGASYHCFYFQFKRRLPISLSRQDTESKEDFSDKVQECITFMKVNPMINYVQSVISIYCQEDGKINNWNETTFRRNYYNNNLSANAAPFDNVLLPLQLLDKSVKEQKRVKNFATRALDSPFWTLESNWCDGDQLIPFYSELLVRQNDCDLSWIKNQFEVACRGSPEIVKLLISKCEWIDVNQSVFSDQSDPPLVVACKHAREDIAEALLDAGADPNLNFTSANPRRQPPLKYACLNSYLRHGAQQLNVLKVLLEKGANVKHPKAVLWAIYNIDLLKYLVQHGCDVNAHIQYAHNVDSDVEFKGWTILDYCIVNKKKESFDYLVDNGFDGNGPQSTGLNTLIYILQDDFQGRMRLADRDLLHYCRKLITVAKVDVNAVDANGHTALYYASRMKTGVGEEIVKLLIQNGAEKLPK